jgi:hypothetical protein
LVDLPPRRPGETPTQIEVSDEQTAEALKRMSNGFMYATEAKAKIAEADEKIAMVNDFEVMVQADPLSIFDNMAGDAKLNIARAMLAENFEALAPEIELWWRDDSERKLFRASNIETRNTARQNFQQKRAWDIEVRKTGQALAALVPEGTPKEVSDEFLIAAGNYLGSIADSRKSRLVSADEVPHLLAHWIKRFGFDAPGTGAPAQNANPPAPTNAAPPVAPAAPVPTAATVAKAQAVITARAAAKATTTVGAGASPVTATNRPPKGLTIEQAADWAMQNLRARSQ